MKNYRKFQDRRNPKSSSSKILNPKNTSWSPVSFWYDDYLETDKDSYQEKVIAPNLTRIISPQKGLKILDLACGQGFFSRKFSDLGADVVGSDISKELISIAKKNSPHLKFCIAPADKLFFAKDESFDVVVMVLAIQNIDNMLEVCTEVRRTLVPGGKFIIVINHPTFRVPKRSSWGYDEENRIQYRRIDGYLSGKKIEISMHPGDKPNQKTVSYHRSLQDFFKAFAKNGFVVSGLEEWISHKKSEKGPRRTAEDVSRREIPLFMMLEARKI